MQNSIVEDQVMVAAPAALVRELINDVASWPQWHRPSAHAEFLAADRIKHWMIVDDHTVRSWTERRRLSDDGRRVIAERAGSSHVTTWTVEEQAYGKTSLHVRVEFPAVGREAEESVAEENNEFLASVRHRAERHDEMERLVISFRDPLYVAGSLADCYAYLFEADKWPERVPHVLALNLEQPEPDVQFFDMDTRSADGSEHTTRSVRICLPNNKIVYKQTKPPATMTAHTGHWLFTETPEGIVLEARHTCTIRPEGMHLLGEGTTVEGARRYLRKVLSANSMGNLRLTKQYAEERAK